MNQERKDKINAAINKLEEAMAAIRAVSTELVTGPAKEAYDILEEIDPFIHSDDYNKMSDIFDQFYDVENYLDGAVGNVMDAVDVLQDFVR